MTTDKFPRWRKERPSDRADEWVDGCSAVRLRRTLDPAQAAIVEILVATVREARLPGLVKRMTTHRKTYARAYIVGRMMGDGHKILARRLGINVNQARGAARRGAAILREYYTQEELEEILSVPAAATGSPSSRP